MAGTKTATFPVTQNVVHPRAAIAPADTTTLKTAYTAGANDAVLKALNAATTETAAANAIAVWLNDGTADSLLGTIPVPANAGFNGVVPSVDLLDGRYIPSLGYDQQGKRVLQLKAGSIIKVGVLTTVATGKTVYVSGAAEEY